LQAQLRGRVASGEKDFVLWNAISVLAELMKVYHALELLETQGVLPFLRYFDKLKTAIAYLNPILQERIKTIVNEANKPRQLQWN